MIYIYKILSRSNNQWRLSFFLPWLGIFIGTIFFLLVDTIMSGMENEIFLKLKNIDSGLKIYPDKNTTYKDIEQYLKNNNIYFEECLNRDVIVGNSNNQSMAKLILCENKFKDDYFKIGSAMSLKLNISAKLETFLIIALCLSLFFPNKSCVPLVGLKLILMSLCIL